MPAGACTHPGEFGQALATTTLFTVRPVIRHWSTNRRVISKCLTTEPDRLYKAFQGCDDNCVTSYEHLAGRRPLRVECPLTGEATWH